MKKNQNEAAVGAFVIIGFIVLALIVFFVSGVYFFRSGYALNVLYDYVSILDKGAPVRMAGVRIGEVSKVELTYDDKSKRMRVLIKLFIEKGVEIRENYAFEIRGTHILSEPHIEISPKPGDMPMLVDGALIQGADPVPVEALVERAHRIATDMEGIVGTFHSALEGNETAKALKQVILNLASLTESMNKVMSGSEEDLAESIQNIKASTDSLQAILEKVKKGEGTAGQLIFRDELYQDLRDFVAEIKARPWRLLKKDNGGKRFLFF